MDQLYDRISTLLESNDAAENMGALRAIDELIDVALGENASKVSKFSNYMRTVFDVKRDPEILELASRVLGHLARAGGAMTADEVEYQVCYAIFCSCSCYFAFSFSRSVCLRSSKDLIYQNCQIKIALEWLRGERVEYRRFAAVLILKVSALFSCYL